MKSKHYLYLIIFSLFALNNLFAQPTPLHELYLKNGSMIKGFLVEVIPDSIVKFETSDGSIFIFSVSEVKEIKNLSNEKTSIKSPSKNPYTIHRSIAGWGVFYSWCFTAVGSAAMGDAMIGTTAIPVVGPFITMSRIEKSGGVYLPGGKDLLIISGITQSAFFIYYIVSWIGEANYVPSSGFSIHPSNQNFGIQLSYKF